MTNRPYICEWCTRSWDTRAAADTCCDDRADQGGFIANWRRDD